MRIRVEIHEEDNQVTIDRQWPDTRTIGGRAKPTADDRLRDIADEVERMQGNEWDT